MGIQCSIHDIESSNEYGGSPSDIFSWMHVSGNVEKILNY